MGACASKQLDDTKPPSPRRASPELVAAVTLREERGADKRANEGKESPSAHTASPPASGDELKTPSRLSQVAKGGTAVASVASSVTTNAKTVSYALPAIHQASSDSSGLVSDALQFIERVLTPVAGVIPFAATAVLVLKTIQGTLEHVDSWSNRDEWMNTYQRALVKISNFMVKSMNNFKESDELNALKAATDKTCERIKKLGERGKIMRFLSASSDKSSLADALENLRQLMLNCLPGMTLELKEDLSELRFRLHDVEAQVDRMGQLHDPDQIMKQVALKQPKMLRDQGDVEARLSVYVPLEYSRSAPSETTTERFPLADVMNSLLQGDGIRLSSPADKDGAQRQSSLLGGKLSMQEARVLLIQGAAGTGKSLFGWKLCQEWNHHNKDHHEQAEAPYPIALFLALPMYKELLSDKAMRRTLMTEYFHRNFGLDDEQVKRIREMAFIIVLDGLDELNDKFHLWTECELYQWSNSFFIVSSRTGWLQGDDINSYLVPRAPDSTQRLYHQLTQLFLLPFSSEQADEYVKQFAKGPDNVSKWSYGQYQEARSKMPELKELGREPLTLFMVLRILPRLSRNTKDSQRLDPKLLLVKSASAIPIPFLHTRRVELYAIFFEDWLDREVNRRLPAKDANEANSFEFKMKHKSMRDAVKKFSEKLAIEMFLHNVTSVHVSAEEWRKSQPQAQMEAFALMDDVEREAFLVSSNSFMSNPRQTNRDTWAMELFFGEGDKALEVAIQKQASAPLRKSGDNYAFLHKSLQEYFSAISMSSELVSLVVSKKLPQVLRNPKDIANLKITKKLLTDDYAVLLFAAELVDQRVRRYIPTWGISDEEKASDQEHPQQFQPFGKALFDLIEASRQFPKEQLEASRLNVAAANAITILNYANVSFAGRDFSGAQLGPLIESAWNGTQAFADLNCALLNTCNLQKANLNGARLQEASLELVDLRGCNLSNVILGRGRTLQGHTESVSCLALSSDGKTLFSGSGDKSICQWSIGPEGLWELKQTLQGHTGTVSCLALSSDGKTLFSGSRDKSIRQWNVATGHGESKQTLQGHTESVSYLALSSDGKTLFSGSGDKSIREWNVETGELKQTLQGHTGTVSCLALSSDGKTLFSGSGDNSIRQWNVDAGHGELKQTLQGHDGAVYCLALSSNGKTLFSGSGNSICEWNVETGESKQTLQGHTESVSCLALSSDGKTLFSSSLENTIRQWNVETGESRQTLQGHTSYVLCLALSSDGKTLFSGSQDKSIRQWNVKNGELKQIPQGHASFVSCLALSGDGKTLVSGDDKSICEWSVETGELKQTLQGHTGTVLCLSTDGKTLFSAGNNFGVGGDYSIREWNVETGELKQTLQGHTGTVLCLALSTDGKTLFSAGNNFGVGGDHSIREWNVETGEIKQTLQGHTGTVLCLALSRDGKTLFAGSRDNFIREWDVETGEIKQTLQGHTDTVDCLALSSDGKTLFSDSYDNSIREWNVETGELKQVLQGHTSFVTCLALSRDGKTLFSSALDSCIREWNAETSKLKQTPEEIHPPCCLSVWTMAPTLSARSCLLDHISPAASILVEFSAVVEPSSEVLQVLRQNGHNALEILDPCTYFAPENIPLRFLKTWFAQTFTESEQELMKVTWSSLLGQLRNLSMITLSDDNSSLSIHRAVQHAIRHRQQLQVNDSVQCHPSYPINAAERFKKFVGLLTSETRMNEQLSQVEYYRSLLPPIKHCIDESTQMAEESMVQELRSTAADCSLKVGNTVLAKEWYERCLRYNESHYGPDHYEVASTLGSLANTYGELGDPQTQISLLRRALAIKEKHYGPDHYQVATALTNLANAYGDLGDHGAQKSLLERALAILENHLGADHYQVAITLYNLANAYGDLGDPQTQKSMLERALKINEKHYGPDHYEVAITLTNLAVACGKLGDPQTQKSMLERALAIQEKHYGPDHYQVATTLANLANAYGDLGDPQTKKSMLERALTINEKHYGPDHYQVATTLGNLANAYGSLGDPQTMKSMLERALTINKKHYGHDHYEVAVTLTNLALAYSDLGDPQTQKSLLERALAINEKHYGPDHYQLAVTLHSLAVACGELGDPQTMKSMLERALAIDEKHYGPDHYEVAITLDNLAIACGDLGDPQTMKSMLERTLAINEKHYGPDHYQVAITLYNLANAYVSLGDPQTQKSMLERALAIKEKHYGPDHYQVAVTLDNLANAYGDLGDPQTKKSLLERALAIKEKHYGPDHYQVAITLTNLANAYGSLGDPQAKKSMLERALVIKEKHYGHDHYHLAITLTSLAIAYGDVDDPETKISLLARAIKIHGNHYGSDHYQVANTLYNLANAYGALGDHHTQISVLERALAIFERHYGSGSLQTAATLINLANAYGSLGDPQTMKSMLERALAINEKHYGPDHFEVAITLEDMAAAHEALGDKAGQRELLRRVLPIYEAHYGHDHNYTNHVRTQLEVAKCVDSNLCTFSFLQKNYVAQFYYCCTTCNLVQANHMGACLSCAKICHQGHDLIGPVFSSGFFCDCGAGAAPKLCQCLVKEI